MSEEKNHANEVSLDKTPDKKINPSLFSRGERRSAARLAATQALYQMEIAGKGLNEIYAEFETFWMGQEVEGEQYKPAEKNFFRSLVRGVLENQLEVDKKIDHFLENGWPLKRIEMIMRAILRCGAYELLYLKDTPVKVAVSEYVDISSAFLEKDEVGMVNGVLDQIARECRVEELAKLKAERAGNS